MPKGQFQSLKGSVQLAAWGVISFGHNTVCWLINWQVCLGVVKAPLGEAQKDNGGLILLWKSSSSSLINAHCKGVGGGGAATAVVEVVLVLILIAMSCLAVYLGWRHYKTRCTSALETEHAWLEHFWELVACRTWLGKTYHCAQMKKNDQRNSGATLRQKENKECS